jgi:hypothetical protein
MSRPILLLACLAAALSLALALELLAGPEQPADVAAAPAPPPAAATPATPPPAGDDAEDALGELVQTVLARPLFSPGRRPAPPMAAAASDAPAAAAGQEDLPRLSGVIVAPGGRRAIFAPAEGHPLVVPEGASIGRFVVHSIAPGQVTLSDTERQHVLRPSHAKGTKP